MQLLRYRDGQKYSDHSDGLISENGGKRIATVLMFLHEPTEGGETSFVLGNPLEKVKERIEGTKDQFSECGYRGGKGFAVKPKVGDAILFYATQQFCSASACFVFFTVFGSLSQQPYLAYKRSKSNQSSQYQ